MMRNLYTLPLREYDEQWGMQAQLSYFNQLADLYKNTAMLPYRDTYNSDGPVLWRSAETSAAPVAPKTIRQELQSDVDLWLKGIE